MKPNFLKIRPTCWTQTDLIKGSQITVRADVHKNPWWTYPCNDSKVLHSIPVWFVDLAQRLGQPLGRLMHGCGKKQEIVDEQKKNPKIYHDSMRINLSSNISSTVHCGGIVFRVCGTVATPTPRRSEQHWFPDWSSRRRSNSWQHWKRNSFLHMHHIFNAESAFFTAGFLFVLVQHSNADRIAKGSENRGNSLPYYSALLSKERRSVNNALWVCVCFQNLPFTAAW